MSLILDGTNGLSDVDGSAATPAIRGTDANTGIYFGNDVIGFSEGGTQCGEFDASANFKFNSGYGSVVTAYGCRAWVNFDGTGTVAIRASGNVTSITDNGTGDYTVNFTNAMPDANYSYTGSCNIGTANYNILLSPNRTTAPTSSAFRFVTASSQDGTFYDCGYVNVVVFR
jgi:hypothetical protein